MSDDDLEREPNRLARNTDPATSHEAAASLNPLHTRRQYLTILEILSNHEDGLTDQELIDLMPFQVEDSGVRSRRNELHEHELVRGDKSTVRPTRSGRNAIVWTITFDGREFLNARNAA